jgi:hypothetical protein
VSTRQTGTTAARLADLPLEAEYRSDTHDLVRDFYVPCLQRSTLDRRAVGYFTSRGVPPGRGLLRSTTVPGRVLEYPHVNRKHRQRNG